MDYNDPTNECLREISIQLNEIVKKLDEILKELKKMNNEIEDSGYTTLR
jgi:hypothetical protein